MKTKALVCAVIAASTVSACGLSKRSVTAKTPQPTPTSDQAELLAGLDGYYIRTGFGSAEEPDVTVIEGSKTFTLYGWADVEAAPEQDGTLTRVDAQTVRWQSNAPRFEIDEKPQRVSQMRIKDGQTLVWESIPIEGAGGSKETYTDEYRRVTREEAYRKALRHAVRKEQDYLFAHEWCEKADRLPAPQAVAVKAVMARAADDAKAFKMTLEKIRENRKARGHSRTLCEVTEDVLERGVRAAEGRRGVSRVSLDVQLDEVTDLTPVASLELRDLNVGGAGVKSIAPLARMSALRVLTLRNVSLAGTDEGYVVLASIGAKLEELAIDASDIKSLDPIVVLRQLKALRLAAGELPSNEVQRLAALVNLRRLSIWVPSEDAPDLGVFGKLADLEEASFNWSLGLNGLAALSKLKSLSITAAEADLPALHALKLDKLELTLNGSNSLARVAGLPLQRLYLNASSPGPISLAPLAGQKDLEFVGIQGQAKYDADNKLLPPENELTDLVTLDKLPMLHGVTLSQLKVSDLGPIERLLAKSESSYGVAYLTDLDVPRSQEATLNRMKAKAASNSFDSVRLVD